MQRSIQQVRRAAGRPGHPGAGPRYFTPLGRNFNNNGIDPDETVELPDESQTEAYDEKGYLKEGYDTQLNAAVSLTIFSIILAHDSINDEF